MSKERILLVEGEDDEKVVEHLARVCGVQQNFRIESEGGFSKLCGNIGVWAREPGLRTLGVLADANDDLESRWKEIVDAAAGAGVRLPDAPAPSGTIVEGRLRTGVWLMPDNRSSGELEDFARKLIPESDPVWPLAERYIATIPEGARKFRRRKRAKANLYAWLASRKHPQRIGAAIGAGDLDAEADIARQFAQWLGDLFEA